MPRVQGLAQALGEEAGRGASEGAGKPGKGQEVYKFILEVEWVMSVSVKEKMAGMTGLVSKSFLSTNCILRFQVVMGGQQKLACSDKPTRDLSIFKFTK